MVFYVKEKMKDNNIVWTCPEHGKEMYFTIKAQEKLFPDNYVYVWFTDGEQNEKMWVRITKGDRKKGVGKINNVPILVGLELGDIVKFKTNKEGITYGYK